MTSSKRNIFRVTGHLCGEFTGDQWIPRTKASGAGLWSFLWSAPEWTLSKQSWGWRFETSSPLCHRNVNLEKSVSYISKFNTLCSWCGQIAAWITLKQAKLSGKWQPLWSHRCTSARTFELAVCARISWWNITMYCNGGSLMDSLGHWTKLTDVNVCKTCK